MLSAPCPRYAEAYEEVLQLPEVRQIINDHAPMFDDISKQTGFIINSIKNIEYLFSTFDTELDYGLKLPAWSHK